MGKKGATNMLISRLASWMVFLGVLLLWGSAGLLSAVIADWERANGPNQLNKLVVYADSTDAAKAGGLTLQEADRLEKAWGSSPISYTAEQRGLAEYEQNKVQSRIVGVNAFYRDYHQLELVSGTSIGRHSVDEHSRVAVISAEVSDQLYRSVQVIGKKMELWGAPFTVIGVFEEHDSLLRQMADDGIPDVLIPITTMLDIRPEAIITGIELSAKPDTALAGNAEVHQALSAIERNPASFRIGNRVLDHSWIAQYESLLLFVYGIAAIYLLLRFVPGQVRLMIAGVKSRLTLEDWPDALRTERSMLAKRGLVAAGLIVCAAAIWALVRFQLYVPPDWIPEELIDVAFYMDKLRSLWQQRMMLAGYAPVPEEELLAATGKLAGRLWLAGAVLGLPIFLLGVRIWAVIRMPISGQLTRITLFVPAAAVITFAAASWANMDYRMELYDAAVMGSLFLVSTSYISNLQRSAQSNENDDEKMDHSLYDPIHADSNRLSEQR
jgi:hypothetical protein